jgi:hypothetical protein
MKKVILILTLLVNLNILWCSTLGVGVNSDKVVIWEYWKVSDGKANNEMLIYNPTNSYIHVVFRKWYHIREGEPERIYTEEDVLLRIKRLNPNNYVLFDAATSEIRELHKGLIEVFVNDKSAGLYDMSVKNEPPKAKIKNGIIINQTSNVGILFQYEIIYETLHFKKNKNFRARVEYLNENFYSSGFPKGKELNPHNIGLADIKFSELKLVSMENFDISFASTGTIGCFEVTFTNLNSKRKIQQRSFNHMIDKGTGQTIGFNIPNNVYFTKKGKYRKRK